MATTSPLRFHIDPSLGTPIYRQIMDQIRAQIAGRRLGNGEFLPSVRQVAQALEVNPMTVSKAYSLLEQEGVVERVRGKGMAVLAGVLLEDQGERQEQLRPLLEAAVQRALELNLTAQQVLDLLRPLLEELDDD